MDDFAIISNFPGAICLEIDKNKSRTWRSVRDLPDASHISGSSAHLLGRLFADKSLNVPVTRKVHNSRVPFEHYSRDYSNYKTHLHENNHPNLGAHASGGKSTH